MKTDVLRICSVVALATFSLAASGADSAGDTNARADAAASLGGALAEAWKKEVDWGPFTFTAGPQEGGDFGAILKGDGATAVKWLNSAPPSAEQLRSGDSMWMRYGVLEFSVDANWSSATDAKNHSSISLKPQVTFTNLSGAVWQDEISKTVSDEVCAPAAEQATALMTGVAVTSPEMLALIQRYELDKKSRDELLGLFQGRKCNVITGHPPRQRIAIGLYPDIRYRLGKFEEGGTIYDADQLILGGGARVFFPSATRQPFFREAPRLSVGYYTVEEDEDSTIPLPEDVREDFLQVDGRVLLRVPFFGHEVSASPLHLDLEVTATKATSGGGDWDTLWKAQLSVQSEGEFLPALTYRAGKEHGLEYDKQVILGFLWQLATSK